MSLKAQKSTAASPEQSRQVIAGKVRSGSFILSNKALPELTASAAELVKGTAHSELRQMLIRPPGTAALNSLTAAACALRTLNEQFHACLCTTAAKFCYFDSRRSINIFILCNCRKIYGAFHRSNGGLGTLQDFCKCYSRLYNLHPQGDYLYELSQYEASPCHRSAWKEYLQAHHVLDEQRVVASSVVQETEVDWLVERGPVL